MAMQCRTEPRAGQLWQADQDEKAEMFLEHPFQVPAFNDLDPAMSNDQKLWMALGRVTLARSVSGRWNAMPSAS
jgi:hypothetical protein